MFSYRPKPIFLGTDVHRGEAVWLAHEWLKTHLHVLGPPGSGKTRGIMLPLFQQLIRRMDATVILLNPKGDLCQLARDATINAGESKRLLMFDPTDEEHIIGYNPLRPNGLPVPSHAKAAREAIRSAWGQSSFDGTPQLARFLFLALCATRELELTLVEAVQMLRAGSVIRAQMLARLKNPFVRESLEYFDSLRESRQEELAASTLARLEAFVMDETVRRIVSQQARSLDLAEVIENRQILLVNLQQYRPLRPDDVRLLGRLLINDIVSHVFSRTGPRTPVFLLIDECHTFATQDLCLVLDQGRELGLHCVLAHQYPRQLLDEDPTGLLYASVMDCARTKIVFGGMSVANLEAVAKELFLGQFDPMKIKDEIRSLVLDPVESSRIVPTFTASGSSTVSTSSARTKSRADMRGTGETTSESRSTGSSTSYAQGSSVQSTDGESFVIREDSDGWGGDPPTSCQRSASYGDNEQRVETSSDTFTTSRSSSKQSATTKSEASQTGTATTYGVGGSISVARVPFYEYKKTYRPSSRTFESLEEFLVGCIQRLKAQPLGHFVLKTPSAAPVFVRAPFVRKPIVPQARLRATLERVFSRSCYSTPAQIEDEDIERRRALVGMPERRTIEVIPHAARSVSYKRKKAPPKA